MSLSWHLLATSAVFVCAVGLVARHLSPVDDPTAPHPDGGVRRAPVLAPLAAVALAVAVVVGMAALAVLALESAPGRPVG